MGKTISTQSIFFKSAALAFSALLSACAGDFSTGKDEKNAASSLKPVAGEIRTKTKFKAGKAYGPASERVIRSAFKPVPRGGGRAVVGKPYKINGRWYKPRHQPNYDRVGIASWYGPNFHGRKTANGEIYDQTALSAAHPTLPLPSYVKVTNVANKRSVIVRVNDRGPFHKSRIIDLSYRTAELLGTRAGGIAKVRVKYIGPARVDGKDEKYLLASYDGPGSVKPSEIAARKKLLAYAGISQTTADEDTPSDNAPPKTNAPKPIVVANKTPVSPTAVSNPVLPETLGQPFELRPTILFTGSATNTPTPTVIKSGTAGVQPRPKPVTGLRAYTPPHKNARQIETVFHRLLKPSTPDWSLSEPQKIRIGVFKDRELAMRMADHFSRFGDVSLGTQLDQGIPSTRIELESNLPFSLKAAQTLAPDAVLVK